MKSSRIRTASSYTVRYSLLQCCYWVAFCLLIGYSSVYLLELGFTSTRIGVLLAVSNLVSAVAQQLLGWLADRYPRIRLNALVAVVFFAAACLAGGMFFSTANRTLVSCIFISMIVISFSIAPSINAMAFKAAENGCSINFGFARGVGSLAYALTSISAGYLFERISIIWIPVIYGVFLAMASFTAAITNHPVSPESSRANPAKASDEESSPGFLGRYWRELVFLLGAILIFYDHMLINNFLKQFTEEIGGTTSQMGTAIFISAIVEFPVMLLFTRLNKKISCTWLLRAAALMFVAKHALTLFAERVVTLYIASFMQIGAYALFFTALLYYFNTVMSGRDLVKGQALANCVISVSSIFASATGGWLIDNVGVRQALAIGLLLSVIGAVVVWFSVRRILPSEK